MHIKDASRKIGRSFIELNQADESEMRQRVLLVDGSFILPNNFTLIIRGVRERFPSARITVLTFFEKRDFLKERFPDIEIVIPGKWIRGSNRQLLFGLISQLRRKFNFVVLSSLDISLLPAAVMLNNRPLLLHNRWHEWYRISQRTLWQVLSRAKDADRNRRRSDRGIKDIIKSFGRMFVILSDINEDELKPRVLLVDNGYTDKGHIADAVGSAKKIFTKAEITLVTFDSRMDCLGEAAVGLNIVSAGDGRARYGLAGKMRRLSKQKPDYLILTALDRSLVFAAFLFFKAKVVLYNRWRQWWSLRIKGPLAYLKKICVMIFSIPLLLYLFVVSTFIILRMHLRAAFRKNALLEEQEYL